MNTPTGVGLYPCCPSGNPILFRCCTSFLHLSTYPSPNDSYLPMRDWHASGVVIAYWGSKIGGMARMDISSWLERVKCLDTLSLHWLTTPLSDLLSLHQIYALI
jgi:hypothetical protein